MGGAVVLLALLAGCGDKDGDTGGGTASFTWPAETADAVATYAQIVSASYTDTVTAAAALDDAAAALAAAPSTTTLAAARQAWLESREPYLQTEVYRFYDGPIDHPDTGVEGLLNAWPLDEHYIDYVVDDASAGIINDRSVAIDVSVLVELNEAGGEKNIATGYHAIEFLLWGQDLSDAGPGDRPVADYAGGGVAENADRRALYLTTASGLLVDHLSLVRDAWAEGAAYRTAFEAAPEDSFAKILTGMIVLSGFETGGERLQAALDSGDREDEHSCFSDNTHRDMIQDIQGVQNVWQGRYTRTGGAVVSGVGVRDIVAAVDADLAAALDDRIAESLALAGALELPFEAEIVPGSAGNARVQALIDSLRAQETLLFEVFSTFGLSVALPE